MRETSHVAGSALMCVPKAAGMHLAVRPCRKVDKYKLNVDALLFWSGGNDEGLSMALRHLFVGSLKTHVWTLVWSHVTGLCRILPR